MNSNIKRGLALVGALSAVSGAAMADVPTGVTTAITSAGTDGVSIVSALAVAGAGVFLIGKVLRKFGLML